MTVTFPSSALSPKEVWTGIFKNVCEMIADTDVFRRDDPQPEAGCFVRLLRSSQLPVVDRLSVRGS